MNFRLFLSTLLFCFTFITVASGQDWQYQWSVSSTQKAADSWTYLFDCDFHNNVYTGTIYGDSVFIADTSFGHPGNYYDWVNWAVAKYDHKGDFIRALDISTSDDNLIFNLELVTDKDQNIYVTSEFTGNIHLNDTIIFEGDTTSFGSPELLIAKLSPEFEIEWLRLISSKAQETCKDVYVSDDDYLYVCCSHGGYGYDPYTIDYFGQDSVTTDHPMTSLLKLDSSGNLIWRKSYHGGYLTNEKMTFDQSENIFITGTIRDTLFYDGDTIPHPHPDEGRYRSFVLKIDSAGDLVEHHVPGWGLMMSDIEVDAFNNFYFAGYVWDTTLFAGDTLFYHADSTINIISKLNSSFEPQWYETLSTGQGGNYFNIDVWEDTLYFAGTCRGSVSIFDTTFSYGGRWVAFLGQVSPQGELSRGMITRSTSSFLPKGFMLDNCKNMLLTGSYTGSAYLGQDTLASNIPYVFDGFLTKINRFDPYNFSFGPDVIVCDSIILEGPEGYARYYWNDSLYEENWLNVSQTGEYRLKCASEIGCWQYDTIFVEVQNGFQIHLGQDTAIAMNDSITLSVDEGYEHYLWSTGDTTNAITIVSTSYGQGEWDIWLEVADGACTAVDTIEITILSSISELSKFGILLFPNPIANEVNILSETKLSGIDILDLKGRIVKQVNVPSETTYHSMINLSNLPSGVYIIMVNNQTGTGHGKLVKL